MASKTQAKHELLALYEDPEGAADAVGRLRDAGFDDTAVEVLSSTPYPEGAGGERHTKHRLFAFPFAGAACGLAIGITWTVGAQLTLPIITGGKPVVALPAIIQIIYEGTLLGAVLFTVIGVLFESRLPDGVGLYDDRISDGYVGVSVVTRERRVADAQIALEEANPVDVISREGSLMQASGTT